MSAPQDKEHRGQEESVQPLTEDAALAALPHNRSVWMLYHRLRADGYPPDQALAATLFTWQETSDTRPLS